MKNNLRCSSGLCINFFSVINVFWWGAYSHYLCGLVSEKFKSFGDFYKNCIFGNWRAITFCSGNWNSAIFPPTLQSVSAFPAPAHKCSNLFSVTALIVRPVSCFHLNPLIITAHFLPSTTKTLAASELNELNFEPRKLVETNAGCVKEQLQRISPYTFWKEVVRQCCVHRLFDACMCPKNSWRRFKAIFTKSKLKSIVWHSYNPLPSLSLIQNYSTCFILVCLLQLCADNSSCT